jgi:starch phosphorylase
VLDENGRWPQITLELPGRTLMLRAWQAQVGSVRLYLLDSNHPLNSPWDRGITSTLYASARESRLLQELVLGVGGWRLLRRLGIEVEVCHLNEGHAAFAVVARAADFSLSHSIPFAAALRATRAGTVFTTHTPVEAAFDRFDPALVRHVTRPLTEASGLNAEELIALGRADPGDEREPFNMAYLALRGSGSVNGVARLHGEVSRRLFAPLFDGWPLEEVPVGHVTNGVHLPTWHSDRSNALWTTAYGRAESWLGDIDGAATAIAAVDDLTLWTYRGEARATLVAHVRERVLRHLARRDAEAAAMSGAAHVLDPNVLTLGFARRFAGYKRADLLFRDEERLARFLLDPDRPAQLIVAGKAHPDDVPSKAVVRHVAQFARRHDVWDRVVFVEDYDMALAQQLAAGVDVWINNPRRPAEACGTSGMKLLVNGGLHCSTLDGWWDEAYQPGLGWAIGTRSDGHDPEAVDPADAEALYDVLEHEIAPMFYDRDDDDIPRRWLEQVRASMTTLTPIFSSDRMVKQYVEECYLPAARAYAHRAADGGKTAIELQRWATSIDAGWGTIRFGRVMAMEVGPDFLVEVDVLLGDVAVDAVNVELFADRDGDGNALRLAEHRPIAGAANGYRFIGTAPADRPLDHYTPRVVPGHPAALVPLEAHRILWGPHPEIRTRDASPDADVEELVLAGT